MAQDIRNRRGELVVSIPDGVVLMPSDPTVSSDGPTLVNNSTSLFQVGRDVLDYGLEISENLQWLMEHFANTVPPQNPVDGQLWWDMSNSSMPVMRVYSTNNGGWGSVAKLSSDATPTLSADMNAAGRKIINLAPPTSAQDAANKNYVDIAIAQATGGSASFLGLTDTPSTYLGQAGRVVRVNSNNTGLEFSRLRFTDLEGVPTSLVGQGGRYVRVNTTSSALEFTNINISHIDWAGAVSVNAQGARINNIAVPISAQDAASKAYVDAMAASVFPASDGIVVKVGASAQARSIISSNDAIAITNGNGVGGNITLTHKTTSQASSINTTRVIQSIGLDAYGHIASLTTIDGNGLLGYVPVNKAGDTMTGDLYVQGSGRIALGTNGDITAHRGNNTGVIFLGNGGNRYLYYDGSNYQLPGANLWINNGLAWTSNNQGPGTGMNSDLLDGYDWNSGQNVYLGIVHAQTPNDSTTGGIRVRANAAHQNAIIQFVNADITHQLGFLSVGPDGNMNYNNGRVWTSLNDGSGSGLDADLLDGRDFGDVINTAVAASGGVVASALGTNGYARFANGMLLQWGRFRFQTNNVSTVFTTPYNIAFGGQAWAVTMMRYDPTFNTYNQKIMSKYGDGDAGGFQWKVMDNDSRDGGSYIFGFDWVAIGPS